MRLPGRTWSNNAISNTQVYTEGMVRILTIPIISYNILVVCDAAAPSTTGSQKKSRWSSRWGNGSRRKRTDRPDVGAELAAWPIFCGSRQATGMYHLGNPCNRTSGALACGMNLQLLRTVHFKEKFSDGIILNLILIHMVSSAMQQKSCPFQQAEKFPKPEMPYSAETK